MKGFRSSRALEIVFDLVVISFIITIASNKLTSAADANATKNDSLAVKQDPVELGKMMVLILIILKFQ